MKILGSLFGLNVSTKGMSVQRKKMDIISENIANADAVRNQNGEPYRRKMIKVSDIDNAFAKNLQIEGNNFELNTTKSGHLSTSSFPKQMTIESNPDKISIEEKIDERLGDRVYMPEHPDADKEGYVEMSNVNIITEMVDMIAASRSYEANLQALNSSKQMIKDSLEI
jgi:flagellar basal-body rod protein FlgC